MCIVSGANIDLKRMHKIEEMSNHHLNKFLMCKLSNEGLNGAEFD